MSRRQNRGTPSPGTQAKMLREHTASVNHRLLPHLRRKARTLRPAWVERRVKELVG